MKINSIFINSSEEAAVLMEKARTKGPIYNAFRLDPSIPDVFASDGKEWEIRNAAFRPALDAIVLKNGVDLAKNLTSILSQYAENGKPLDTISLFSRLALDVVCKEVFNYDLDSLPLLLNGEEDKDKEGNKLFMSVKTLLDASAQSGFYPRQGMPPVSKDQVEEAKGN
jgi:hypothetical protein